MHDVMRTLNYNHLRYFWTVAREGTIARAAEVLHLTPQTISGQLGELELRLDVRLFSRNGRKLVLTDVGRLVYDYAENIFQLGNELTEALNRSDQNNCQRIRIGIVERMPRLLGCEFLKPAFEFDNVSITCRSGKFDHLLGELSLHRLDMVLSDTPLNSSGNIRAYNHHLGDSPISFFTSSDKAKSYRLEFPDCLDKMSLLLPTMNTPLRRALERWFRTSNISPHVCGEFEDSTLQHYMSEVGAGVCVAPKLMKARLQSCHALECFADTRSVTESYYLISMERKLKQPVTQAVFQYAHDNLFDNEQSMPAIHAVS